MTELWTLVLTGLVSGAIYSLIGTSLTLTYQTTGIFNLGYGAIAFTSAFVYYLLHVGLGWSILPACLATIVLMGPGVGALLDRLIFRRLTDSSDAAKVMATVGVLVFLPALGYLIEQIINALGGSLPDTTQVASAPGIGPSPAHTWHLGSVPLNSNQLIVFVAAAVVAVATTILLRGTRLGLRMRALVDRPHLAQLRAVNRQRTSMIAWMVGCTLASLTGVIAAPIFRALQPNTYNIIMFVAIAATVVGGFKRIPVVFASGLVIGIIQSVVARYASFASGIPGFNSAVPFVVLLVGIMIWGRTRVRVAGAALATDAEDDPMSDLSRMRRGLPWVIATVVLIAVMGFFADDFWMSQIALGLALAIVFLSYTVTAGLGGVVSLAQAAFAMVSALVVGLLMTRYHVPFPLAVLIGVAVAAFLGVLIAVPALRVGGLALALATLALGFLGDNVLFQWSYLTNGLDGWFMIPPKYGPVALSNTRILGFVLLAIVGLVIVVVRNVHRSTTGRAAVAMNASDAAARMSGISPSRVKLFVVSVGAAIAGLGGAMLYTYTTAINGSTYPTSVGLVWLAGVVLWGLRRPASAVLAGLTVALFPAFLSGGFDFGWLSWGGTSNPYIANVLFGLGAIQMAKDPRGLLSFNSALLRAARDRRAARKAAGGRDTAPSSEPAAAVPSPHAPGAPSAAADTMLTVDGISAGYGHVSVLKDVSLTLPRGTITAVVGVNGAGKSTLCHVISGQLEPTSGSIAFDGEPVERLAPHTRSSRGLMVAPESRGIFPSLTVDDNLRLLLPSSDDRERVYERFPMLSTRRDQPAGSLSGGEQQTLTMAPLLVDPPKLLVADEPTLGLAPKISADVLSLCRELRDSGTTLLLVEEKAGAVLDIADRVAVLELGRVAWTGAADSLVREDLHARYVGALTAAAPAPPEHEELRSPSR